MTDQLTPDERNYLNSLAKDFDLPNAEVAKALRILDEQAEMLERVRAVLIVARVATPSSTIVMDAVEAALASQPEAVTLDPQVPPGTIYAVSQPEAPKGQEAGPVPWQYHAELRRDLANAKATIVEQQAISARWAELYDQANADIIANRETHNRVAAQLSAAVSEAKARIAELEREKQTDCLAYRDGVREAQLAEQAANARADAAERATEAWREAAERVLSAVETERGQLAARVKELEAFLPLALVDCTPEEREVLEAMQDAVIIETKGFGPYIAMGIENTRAAVAELANRAAKAKRGGA